MDRKERADLVLVRRGLAPTRSRARWLIKEGFVLHEGRTLDKPGRMIWADAAIEVLDGADVAGKGALKLRAALDAFGIDVTGLAAADVGACTGGFTQVLLSRGARRVFAVDVGKGQLRAELSSDPRVVNMEGTDARDVGPLPEKVDVCTVDVSFISLRMVLPHVSKWLTPEGRIVALVKPQFEGGPGATDRRGVVSDDDAREAIVRGLEEWCAEQGFRVEGRIVSPVKGAKGNVEHFLCLRLQA